MYAIRSYYAIILLLPMAFIVGVQPQPKLIPEYETSEISLCSIVIFFTNPAPIPRVPQSSLATLVIKLSVMTSSEHISLLSRITSYNVCYTKLLRQLYELLQQLIRKIQQ